ncbi:hypothetical protein ACFFKU_17450 [Kineococcus gynurae]|uniref:Glycosyl transferase family 2 n=1 Tax=Kineococcus gynurae TaxID=452979 RepID=A0ABV5LNZ4_9ACTN
MERAVIGLPVPPAVAPQRGLENTLEHLVAAADEAAAGGVPTLVVVAATAAGAVGETERLLAHWAPLVALVDDVALVGSLHPGPALAAADALVADPATTLLLTTVSGVRVHPTWVLDHVRHHRGGALASTAPVRPRTAPSVARQLSLDRGPDPDPHPVASNLAVRASLYREAGPDPASWPLQFALTPVVELAVVIPRVRSAGPR